MLVDWTKLKTKKTKKKDNNRINNQKDLICFIYLFNCTFSLLIVKRSIGWDLCSSKQKMRNHFPTHNITSLYNKLYTNFTLSCSFYSAFGYTFTDNIRSLLHSKKKCFLISGAINHTWKSFTNSSDIFFCSTHSGRQKLVNDFHGCFLHENVSFGTIRLHENNRMA